MEQEFLNSISSYWMLVLGAAVELFAIFLAIMAVILWKDQKWHVKLAARIGLCIFALTLFCIVKSYIHAKQLSIAASDPYLWGQYLQVKELDTQFKTLKYQLRERLNTMKE